MYKKKITQRNSSYGRSASMPIIQKKYKTNKQKLNQTN
jgi:hypothetical protein